MICYSSNTKLIQDALPGKTRAHGGKALMQEGVWRGVFAVGQGKEWACDERGGLGMECSARDLTLGQPQLPWHPDACQPGLTCLTGPERDPCVARPQARAGVWQRRLVPGEGAQSALGL